MVSMGDELLARLDAAAEKADKSRSELLRDALRLYLAQGNRAGRTEAIERIRSRLADRSAPADLESLVRSERQR